jgi:hypothetical protein
MVSARSLIRGGFVAAAAAAVFVNVASAYAITANTKKCQAAIESLANKYEQALQKALSSCADAVRKQQSANVTKPGSAPMATAAKFCETTLLNVYDVTGSKPGKSAADKFRTAMEKLTLPTILGTTCVSDDLTTIGHLVSGSGGQAPGTSILTFLEDWQLLAQEQVAIQQQLASDPDFFNLISTAVQAPESKSGKHDGTSCPCSDAGNPVCNVAGQTPRPNLCALGPECVEKTCQLDAASQAELNSAGLGDLFFTFLGQEALSVCQIGPASPIEPGLGAGGGFGNTGGVLWLIGNTIAPVPSFNIGGLVDLCIKEQRSEGWCDCSGLSLPNNWIICQDRIGDDTGTDACGLTGGTADPNYPGTTIGPISVIRFGSSSPGDCLDLITTQLTLVTDRGTDTQPCTNDDTAAPQPPVALSLTTGVALATLTNAVQTAGACSVSGTPCIENGNCPGSQTCSNPSPSLTGLAVGPFAGAKKTCAYYAAGNLGASPFDSPAQPALSLVGAFPVAGGPAPVGDSVFGLTLTCK